MSATNSGPRHQRRIVRPGVRQSSNNKREQSWLFKLAKEKLESDKFGQISSKVPEADTLAASAPGSGFLGSALGGLASSLSGGKSDFSNLAGLVGGFSKLGLDADMLGKFVPIILSFVKDKGGDVVQNILSKALK